MKQASVLEPLARRKRLRFADVESARTELGVSRRRFYELLSIHRQRAVGAPPRGHRTGLHSRIEDQQEALIGEAIVIAGPAARGSDVYRTCLKLSRCRGLTAPSENAVRRRLGRELAAADLVNRFDLGCAFVVDLCPLALRLVEAGRVSTAWLLAAFDARTGSLVAHELHAGLPLEFDVTSFLSGTLGGLTVAAEDSCGYTKALSRYTLERLHLENGLPLVIASHTRSLVGGSVLRAIYGRCVGRVPLRSEPLDVEEKGPVPIERSTAAAVFELLLNPSEAEDRSACDRTSRSPLSGDGRLARI